MPVKGERPMSPPFSKQTLITCLVLAVVIVLSPACRQSETPAPTVLSAPADQLYVQIDKAGYYQAEKGLSGGHRSELQ